MILMMVLCVSMVVAAQGQGKDKKFSPEKFQADMEMYIVKEAGLTKAEADKFFPLYNEMKDAQRERFEAMKAITSKPYADDASAKSALEEYDKLDIELKKLQQTYHRKFLTVISARKLFLVIKAESNFHRDSLKKMRDGGGRGQGQGKHPGS